MTDLRKSIKQKQPIFNVVKLDSSKCSIAPNQSMIKRCTTVAIAASPDAVFLSGDEIEEAKSNGKSLPMVRMGEYSRTEFEELRRYFMEDLPPVDQLDPVVFDDLIIRVTRFSVWIRVYDKQIGKGSSVSNFRRGIQRILELWQANAHFHPEQVEIITAECEHFAESESDYAAEQKRNRIRECNERVRTLLANPLRSALSVTVKISIKQDCDRIFHARHLQTQTVAVLVDRGFDLQNDRGDLRRNFLKVDLGSQCHLKECRGLADSDCE
ncbi:MAG: hypothetical protein R3C18_07115 [Planctomycetaceae bacterium]